MKNFEKQYNDAVKGLKKIITDESKKIKKKKWKLHDHDRTHKIDTALGQLEIPTKETSSLLETTTEDFLKNYQLIYAIENLRGLQLDGSKTADGLKVSALKTACGSYAIELDKIIDKELKKIRAQLLKKVRARKSHLTAINKNENQDEEVKQLEKIIVRINAIIDYPNTPTQKGQKIASLEELKLLSNHDDPKQRLLAHYVDTKSLDIAFDRRDELFNLLSCLKTDNAFIKIKPGEKKELKDDKEKLSAFNELFDASHSPLLLIPLDKAGKKFIAAVMHILKTIGTLGYYAYADAKKRGSIQFWKTPEEILKMKKKEIMEEKTGRKMKK